MYLQRIGGSIKDIAFDYTMARYHRQRETEETIEGLQNSIQSLGPDRTPEQVTAVTLQWLVQVMSSK